jgi:protein TonB
LKIFSIFVLSFFLHSAFGQLKEEQYFVFDKDWKITKVKKASYFLRIRQTIDSNYEWTYYQMYGPRIKLETFKDEKAKIRNGKYIYYYSDGTIDSTGAYFNGVHNGSWYFMDTAGKIIWQKDYNMGIVSKDIPIVQKQEEGNNGSTLKPGEIESTYPGGVKAWQQYLMANLHYPDRAVNNEIMGDVRLQFIVDTDGSILEPEINKSVEFSLDEEALRIITKSINWAPASKNGRNVKSYKIQPIRFRLQKG